MGSYDANRVQVDRSQMTAGIRRIRKDSIRYPQIQLGLQSTEQNLPATEL